MQSLPTNIDGPLSVIGDVHGRAGLLHDLLARLAALPDFAERRIVFAGDFLDRGPDPRGALYAVLSLRREHPKTTAVMGNHDLAIAAALGLVPAPAASNWPQRYVASYDCATTFKSYGVPFGDLPALAAAMPDAHQRFLAGLRCVEHPEYLIVHAGLLADAPFAAQLAALPERDSSVNRPSWLCDRSLAHALLPSDRPLTVVSGHVPVPQVTFRAGRVLVDTTGGLWGELSAVLLPERLVVTSGGARGDAYRPARSSDAAPTPVPEFCRKTDPKNIERTSPMTNERRGTLRLLLCGLAAGDATGSSVEFTPQSQIPKRYASLKGKGWPFRQAGGGPFDWRPGQATDDGDQALCLIESYVELGRFDPADVGRRLVGWLNTNPPDVGGTTRRTLGRLRSGVPWHDAAYDDFLHWPTNAANGSIMRNGVLPGICFGQDLDDLFRATVQHSIITHYAPLPVLTCAIQSWIIADELSEWGQGPAYDADWLDHFYADWTGYLQGEDDPHVRLWIERTKDHVRDAGERIEAADFDPHTFNPFETDFTGRAGYCLLALQVAVWALLWSKLDDPFPVPDGCPPEVFERRGPWCIAWPAMVGEDADTVGAVTGSIVAAAHGSVPASMAEGLEAVAAFDASMESDRSHG